MANSYLHLKIKQNMSNFSETEKKLADFILSLNREIINKSISQLSEETGISQTTIFNFVKKIGFKGYQDFKLTIASNLSNESASPNLTAYTDITDEDDSIEIAKKIINFNVTSLLNLHKLIDKEKLDHIIKLMLNSKTIHFFGLGGSSILANDSYHKFIRSKLLCNYISDYHMQLSYSTKLTNDDCVFLFSHSGQTIETINVAKTIQTTGAKIIVLTGNAGSELLNFADESLIIISEESKFRTETLTSRILYLTIMDIIYTNIMYKDPEGSQESMKRVRGAIALTKTNNDFIL